MKKRYHILDSAKQQPVSPNDLTRLLSQNSQLMLMLPLVELVEQCRGAVDEVIDVTAAPPFKPCWNCRRSKLPVSLSKV